MPHLHVHLEGHFSRPVVWLVIHSCLMVRLAGCMFYCLETFGVLERDAVLFIVIDAAAECNSLCVEY